MPTEHGRVTWTDERLDDLARRMDQGFERVDRDMKAGFARVDEDLRSLNLRIDALQRTMLAMMATMLIGFAAVLVQL